MSGTITIALYWILYFYKLIRYCYYHINYKLSNQKPLLLLINNNKLTELTFDVSLVNYNNNICKDLSFIKYTVYSNNKLQTYYKRILCENDIISDVDIVEYMSTVNILSISVIINDNEYDINIYEFNLVNNKLLDEPFIKWYLNKYYNIQGFETYEIIIIDNDVNVTKISNKDFIIIDKDRFIIKTI